MAHRTLVALSLMILSNVASANPYWDESAVPVDAPSKRSHLKILPLKPGDARGTPILRIQIDWMTDETYRLTRARIEDSGTQALFARAKKEPKLGSYVAVLKDKSTGTPLFYDAIGTGKEYRKLVRAFTFRFPLPSSDVDLEFYAENPVSGARELVLKQDLTPSDWAEHSPTLPGLQTTLVKAATQSPKITVGIYAEGYRSQKSMDGFLTKAKKIVEHFKDEKLPLFDNLEFVSVFALSNTELGPAKKLSLPVKPRDSFLGLYYPYWNDFGRWYHVVYPTDETKYRDAIGQIAYDYPIALIQSHEYWGVGNYNELTAIPSDNSSFRYLLLHEFGHFMGLNEEYEGGGPTELEFAPEIEEPFSQNITFQRSRDLLKWAKFVDGKTPIPTPAEHWRQSKGALGLYAGGYADSDSARSRKPGFACLMESSQHFCAVCRHALEEKLEFDGVDDTF